MAKRPMTGLFIGAALVAGAVLGMTVWREAPEPQTSASPAESPVASGISVTGAWARPTTGKTGAAYLDIGNAGAEADRLVAVTSPVAPDAQIHDMQMDGTIMRMRKLDGLDIPAGGHVAIAPGGTHIMLIGLAAPLVEGDRIALHLTFEKAGAMDVMAEVRKTPPVAGDEDAGQKASDAASPEMGPGDHMSGMSGMAPDMGAGETAAPEAAPAP